MKNPHHIDDEIKRSFLVYQTLSKYPAEVQNFIRSLMRDSLYRDKIISEYQFRELTKHKAEEFKYKCQTQNICLASWEEYIIEAKKQLTDYYFAANNSIGYLKSLIYENGTEIESIFNINVKQDFEFEINLEKADIMILIDKLYSFENLSLEEKKKNQHEINELKIVLIRRDRKSVV